MRGDEAATQNRRSGMGGWKNQANYVKRIKKFMNVKIDAKMQNSKTHKKQEASRKKPTYKTKRHGNGVKIQIK